MKNKLAAETVIIAKLLHMLLTFRFHTATITVTTSAVPTESAATLPVALVELRIV